MKTIDLSAMVAQRAEATGAEDGRIPFSFNGKQFTFRDPMMLTDEDQEILEDIANDESARLSEIAEFWMGEDEWGRFRAAGGTAPMFRLVIEENARREQEYDAEGKSFARTNRSQRRAAARKR